jgi:formimidoylglutamate deiminase
MKVHAATALLTEGWADNVLVDIDGAGFIGAVTPGVGDPPEDCERLSGPVIPGMPNLHSHAFQRAMAGLTEARGPGEDSFWTWRQRMYAFVERLTPEQVQDIAAQLYVEMLQAGYTNVGEFHYLHHQADGSPYETPSEMSDRIIAAARETGIAITHLPVLYACNGFGGAAPEAGQRRFLNDSDAFAVLVEDLIVRHRDDPLVRIGIAPHSLRAVTREQLNGAERKRLAAGDAVVGLCPTTEANLGDGVFSANEFLAEGGRVGIGSDSNVSVSAIEELRLLEYGQRLSHRLRAMLSSDESPSVGRYLYDVSVAGGAQALAQPVGALEVGRRADLVVLDGDTAALACKSGDAILDSLVFAAHRDSVKDVMVAGRWRIRDGHHDHEDAIFDRYKRTLATLLA